MKTKAEADYFKDAKKNFCKDCSMFRDPANCTLVKGYIYSMGSCKYFERKTKLVK